LQLLPEALDLELKSLKVFTDAGFSDDKLAGSYYAIAELYRQLEDFNSAKIYFSKSLELDIKSGDRSYIGHSQVKMAQATLGLNQIDLSLDYAIQALNTFSEINSERDQAWAKSNIALAYAKHKQFKLAEKYFEQSYQVISKREGDNSLLSSILYKLSETKFNLQKYNEAKKFGLESLNLLNQTPYLKYKVKTLEILVKVELHDKNYKQASEYQTSLFNALKKLNTEVYNNRLTILQNSLDTVHKDLAIKALELDKNHKQTLLDQNKLQNKVTILIYSIIVILLLGLILKLWSKRKIIKLEKRLLAESMERKKTLFSDLSHELRTPLTVLKLQLESLEFDLVNDKEAEFKSMHVKIDELNQLVSDINELSLMDDDSINIIKEPFKCKLFISGFSNEFKALASDFDYTEEIILNDNVMLFACRQKIQQVLANLAANSIKFTDAPGRIHFSCKQKHNKLVLSVSDASPGVPNQSQNKIFERLYTEETSRNKDLAGNGLGLAISKSIIEMHDGSIKAKDSRLGGLKVIISLPLYKNET
jgi:signal transduction histidine kinase